MGTFSTNQADKRQQEAKRTLQYIQRDIVLHSTWASDLAQEVQDLRTQKPLTTQELFAQQRVLVFKERQLNEIRNTLNRLESKAYTLAQAIRAVS